MAGADICFLATSKSGLGHLRRAATIARSLRLIAPDRVLHLITNAPPVGIGSPDLAAFQKIAVTDRTDMATGLPAGAVMVLDTITVPNIERLGAPLALVLRETPAAALHRFRLATGRRWDHVIIANPKDHWSPDPATLQTRALTEVGWIYRTTGPGRPDVTAMPTVLVATGGGGTAETARDVYARIDKVLVAARQLSPRPFQVVQAIGPRAQTFGQLGMADRIIDPGSQLNALFRDADIVISTAGYNSVLELATTDTPALLVPIPRSIDDQTARARLWAEGLGAEGLGSWLDETGPAAAWLAQQVIQRRRRTPVDLGPSGEDWAARLILGLA